MKTLALALVLLASAAHAGGLCTDFYSDTDAVTASEVQVWSQAISGGAISDGQAIRVTVSLTLDSQTWQTVNANVYLNGQEIGSACAVGNVESGTTEFMLTRTGTAMGGLRTRMWSEGGAPNEWVGSVTDLAWTQQQTLAVKLDGEASGSARVSVCVER